MHIYKQHFFIIVLMLLYQYAVGQNMVSNCSFEQRTGCPNYPGQLSLCKGWRQYHAGSADYFACGNKDAGMPANFVGHQAAADGSAYAGIINYLPGTDYKEYIATAIKPLTKGNFYEISMSVSVADSCQYFGNDLGAWLYDQGPSATLPMEIRSLKVKPQASFAGYGLTADSLTWKRFADVFYADSAYDNLVIGGFTRYDKMFVLPYNPLGRQPYSYYYIDSVVIKLAHLGYALKDGAYCVGDTIKIPFAPLANIYATNNIFHLQLSDGTGDFTNAITVDSIVGNGSGIFQWIVPAIFPQGNGYKFRVVADSPQDTSIISHPITIGNVYPVKPIAVSNSPVCEHNKLTLNTTDTLPGALYSWAGPAGFTAAVHDTSRNQMKSADTGDYIVTVNLNGCTASDTTRVIMLPAKGFVEAQSNSPLCEGDILMFSTIVTSQLAANTGVKYQWSGPGGFSSIDAHPFKTHAAMSDSGIFRVVVSVTGCTDGDTLIVPVTVNALPDNPHAYADTPICAGDTLLLHATAFAGADYLWTGPFGFSDTAANVTIPAILPIHNGVYILTETINNCSVSDTVYVDVYTIPLPPVSSNSPLRIGDTLQLDVFGVDSTYKYSWTGPNGYRSDSAIAVLNNISRINAGTYALTISKNGCSTGTIVLVTVDGIPDTTFFLVYPNANNGRFTVMGTAMFDQQVSINLTSSNGQLVYETTAATQNHLLKQEINLKDALASGIYTLRARMDGHLHVVRIVVERE